MSEYSLIAMARTVSIDDETILRAAREVFLERGVRATTAEVAQRAGVSEGSLFKRWKRKDDLFRAAMDESGPPEFVRYLRQQAGKGDLRETLQRAGKLALEFFRLIVPLAMTAWSDPKLRGSEVLEPPMVRGIRAVSALLAAEMDAGRLRHMDPEIITRAFFGAIYNFVSMEHLYQSNNVLPMDADVFIRDLVDILWNGIAPTPNQGEP